MFSRREKRKFETIVGRRVIVHLNDRRSVAGVLIGEWIDAIAVAHGRILIEETNDSAPLDGETIFPRSGIAFVQADTPTATLALDFLPTEI